MTISLSRYLSERLHGVDPEYQPFDWHGLRGVLFIAYPNPEPVARHVLCPAPPVRLFKDSRSVTAMLCEDADRREQYFYKRYNSRGFWHDLKKLFQYPRPYRCLAAALRLRMAGFATPRVLLAATVCKWGFWPQRQYLLCEPLPAFAHFLPRYMSGDLGRRLELFRSLIGFVAALHEAGIEHGDLSMRNIYCRPLPEEKFGDFGLIDLDGCRIYASGVPVSRRERELARVVSSAYRVRSEHGAPANFTVEELTGEAVAVYRKTCGIELRTAALVPICNRFLRHTRRHRK